MNASRLRRSMPAEAVNTARNFDSHAGWAGPRRRGHQVSVDVRLIDRHLCPLPPAAFTSGPRAGYCALTAFDHAGRRQQLHGMADGRDRLLLAIEMPDDLEGRVDSGGVLRARPPESPARRRPVSRTSSKVAFNVKLWPRFSL